MIDTSLQRRAVCRDSLPEATGLIQMKRFLLLLLFSGLLSCLNGCGQKTDIPVDKRLGEQDIFSNVYYEETCFDALHQMEHLYTHRDIPVPDYHETRLEYFSVYTVVYSTTIERIDVRFVFEYGDTLYVQSLVITDEDIRSSIDSSPRPERSAESPAISLHEFLTAMDHTDFAVCTDMKPDADLYGIEFAGLSDTVYRSTDEVRRILINGERWDEFPKDRRLDHWVPLVDFIGAVSQDGGFRDDKGLQVYMD